MNVSYCSIENMPSGRFKIVSITHIIIIHNGLIMMNNFTFNVNTVHAVYNTKFSPKKYNDNKKSNQ